MLDTNDKNWMVENFVTRGEFRSEMSEIKEGLKDLKQDMQKVLNAVDKFNGRVTTLEEENDMGAATLERHGVQIGELATATGTALSA